VPSTKGNAKSQSFTNRPVAQDQQERDSSRSASAEYIPERSRTDRKAEERTAMNGRMEETIHDENPPTGVGVLQDSVKDRQGQTQTDTDKDKDKENSVENGLVN
jgi:hypothetical protein